MTDYWLELLQKHWKTRVRVSTANYSTVLWAYLTDSYISKFGGWVNRMDWPCQNEKKKKAAPFKV